MSALRGRAAPNNITTLVGSDHDLEYLTDITVGGQNFKVIVDTGSSDTWLVKKGFSCLNLTGAPESAATCAFGSDGFDPAASSAFQPFPNVIFNVTYGDKEFVSGPVGFDTVSVGGLTVTKQEIGTPDVVAWEGDGVHSGILGLAFPFNTRVFNTTDSTQASVAKHIPYDPFFFTAVKQGLSSPFFSLALNRGANGNSSEDSNLGFIAFGGTPPVDLGNTTVTVPIQGYSITGSDTVPIAEPSNSKEAVYLSYTVDVEAYVFPGSTAADTASNNTILDSGTTLNVVPSKVAEAYNAQFVPKATFDTQVGLYTVACNASVPAFSVMLGGQSFTIDARDQIVQNFHEDGTVFCVSGTQAATDDPSGGPDLFILGDVFLHNVVTTFNIQTNEITITQRAPY
ncbi:acid protease [Mycena polygramma]|nr:acid protease [Mycena polygramma]